MPASHSVTSIAAMHVQNGGAGPIARLVFATVTPAPSGSGRPPSLAGLRAQAFPLSDLRAIADALESGKVQVLVRVLSSSQTIAKSVAVPELESGAQTPAQAADALALLAETELPANVPAHRRAAGAIRPGGQRFADRKPAALLTAWPALPSAQTSSRAPWPCPEVYVAEVGALAALASACGGCELAAYVDRDRAAGAVVAAGSSRTIARVFRLPEAADAQAAAAARILTETAGAAGLPAPNAPPSSVTALVLDPAPAGPPVPAELRDATWRSSNALAFGAIAAFVGLDSGAASLVNLHEREPKARPPVWERAVQWFGHPGRAAAAIVLCVLVALALPLGAAYAHFAELHKATGGVQTVLSGTSDAEKQVGFYRVLRDKRWPMTKLLADLAGAAPVGVVLDSVDLSPQNGQVTVRGSAESSDQVTTFRVNLTNSNIFSQVKTPSIQAGASSLIASDREKEGVSFTLTASIASGAAMVTTKPVDDFAANPLVDRLYSGTRAARRPDGGSARPARASSSRQAAPTSGRASRSVSGRSGTERASSSSSSSRAPASSSSSVPPPLSADQIARLDSTAAMLEWATRKKAAVQPGVDEAVRKRLLDESEKAKARYDQTKAAAPAGGAR